MADFVISELSQAEKQVLLKDLKTAYYTGATRIKFRERDVTYRSGEEMRKIIADLEGDLNPPTAGRRKNVISTTFNRGY